MSDDPMFAAGRPDLMAVSLGLNQTTAAQIGTIIVFAGNVEFRLERAIWRLQDHRPRNIRHATDAKPIGELIAMFKEEGEKRQFEEERRLVQLWCDTARPAFHFRHSIAHGAAFRLSTRMLIERNHSWEGEVRKRPAASLWGDQQTLGSIQLTFAVLLRTINSIGNRKRTLAEVASSAERMDALERAKSLIGAMASQPGPWFEGY
jgi:hypothetical protein